MTTVLKEMKNLKRTVKYWWLFPVLGVFLIIGGIWVMVTPVESYVTLAILFSAMVFVNGIFDIIVSISNRDVLKGWGWHLTGGVLEVLMGIVLMAHPGLTMDILPLMLGFWLMFGSVSTISAAFDLRSYRIKGWGWILVLGILLMISSFIILLNPIFGSRVIVFMTSFAIISYGVAYIAFGMKLKNVKDFVGDIKDVFAKNLDDLKSQVLAAMKGTADQAASMEEISKKFDDYKDNLTE